MKYPTFILLFLLGLAACKSNLDTKEANRLKEEATNLIQIKNYTAAIEAAKQAFDKFKAMGNFSGQAESLYLTARAYALGGDFANAVSFGESGSKICQKHINYPLEFKINNTLSWAYFMLGRDFNENLSHQKRQLYVVEQMEDDHAKALVYNNYGYDATVSGALPITEAIRYIKFANNYYARTENHQGRWYTLMNLTWQYRLKNELDSSAYFGQYAVLQAKRDQDRHAIIETSVNLGETLLYQNKIAASEPYYEEALRWSQQKEDRDKYVFDVYYSNYLWILGKKEEAISILEKAINFLQNSEVFYEMLGRAFLAKFSFQVQDYETTQEQIEVFKNPRSNYISQEAKILVAIVEAKMLAREDRDKAKTLLHSKIKHLNNIGAQQLLTRIKETIKAL